MVDAGKRGEGVPLARGIVLGLEEGGNELSGIWNQRRGVLVNRGNSKDGILANVCVTVLETGSSGGKKGLDELGLAELAEEAEGVASNVLVGMLKIVSYAVATK